MLAGLLHTFYGYNIILPIFNDCGSFFMSPTSIRNLTRLLSLGELLEICNGQERFWITYIFIYYGQHTFYRSFIPRGAFPILLRPEELLKVSSEQESFSKSDVAGILLTGLISLYTIVGIPSICVYAYGSFPILLRPEQLLKLSYEFEGFLRSAMAGRLFTGILWLGQELIGLLQLGELF